MENPVKQTSLLDHNILHHTNTIPLPAPIKMEVAALNKSTDIIQSANCLPDNHSNLTMRNNITITKVKNISSLAVLCRNVSPVQIHIQRNIILKSNPLVLAEIVFKSEHVQLTGSRKPSSPVRRLCLASCSSATSLHKSRFQRMSRRHSVCMLVTIAIIFSLATTTTATTRISASVTKRGIGSIRPKSLYFARLNSLKVKPGNNFTAWKQPQSSNWSLAPSSVSRYFFCLLLLSWQSSSFARRFTCRDLLSTGPHYHLQNEVWTNHHPASVQKQFSRDNHCRGRSKPVTKKHSVQGVKVHVSATSNVTQYNEHQVV